LPIPCAVSTVPNPCAVSTLPIPWAVSTLPNPSISGKLSLHQQPEDVGMHNIMVTLCSYTFYEGSVSHGTQCRRYNNKISKCHGYLGLLKY
jgi:hypothetical protein